jgi:hypothetical protein
MENRAVQKQAVATPEARRKEGQGEVVWISFVDALVAIHFGANRPGPTEAGVFLRRGGPSDTRLPLRFADAAEAGSASVHTRHVPDYTRLNRQNPLLRS